MTDKLELCPRCGGEVEWINNRDLDILNSYIRCEVCDLTTFHVESMAFMSLPNKDYESAKLKYNTWCLTKPTTYGEERWEPKQEVIDEL